MRLRGLAGPGTAAAFVGRKGAAWTNIKGRASRYTPALDYGSHVALELAWAKDDPGKVLAIWNVGQETENACGYRACEQNGQYLSDTSPDDRIDVLMCENDILAMGAMDEIRARFHLRVPEDIAIVGFDNYELSGSFGYGITTYEQPRDEMIDAILSMVKGRSDLKTVTLQGEFVVRNST